MAFLQLIRFKNLIVIVLMQYLLRYGLLLPMLNFYNLQPELSNMTFALLVITTVFLAASGYVINDYFDIKTDLINRPNKVVAGHVYQRRTVLLWHVIFTFLGMFLGLFLAYITRKASYAIMFIFIPGLLWYYSTTLKKQILIGNLAISFLTAMVPYFVVSLEFSMLARVHGAEILSTEACSVAWFWTTGFAFFAFICNFSREIIKDLEDIKGDELSGCHTLPVELGEGATKTVVMMLNFFTIIVLWAVYFFIPELYNSSISLLYFVLFLTIPYLILTWMVLRSKDSKGYYMASQLSKVIMLMGILFIFVARTFFK